MVRIVLMYYLNLEKFLNQPDADLKIMLAGASESPPMPSLFVWGGLDIEKSASCTISAVLEAYYAAAFKF